MVRGRRKCAKGRIKPITDVEDVSCDAPKKKDSKLSKEFQGKLSHASPQISTPPITKYFPPLEPAPDIVEKSNENVPEELQPSTERASPRRSCNEPTESNNKTSCEEKFLQQTVGRSPHKIQLCEDITPLSPSSALSQLRISLSPKRATKSRRRLNPSQTVNQQATPKKTVPKPSCCNTTSTVPVPKVTGNHKLTEYFPVRRSVRKTKRTVLEERQRDLEEAIVSQREDGLEVHNFEGKGRGVVTTRQFSKGEFVVEYAGELIDICEAKEREKNYAQDQNTGCYMYYFKYRNTQYWTRHTPSGFSPTAVKNSEETKDQRGIQPKPERSSGSAAQRVCRLSYINGSTKSIQYIANQIIKFTNANDHSSVELYV
ncbi:histone-lysine N-methyltransferase Set8 isoform X2 [Periplaneta americana]|uniref:histone-lysine N-methyltransferase Set8 isoform X2 n=1 Tax=Periplaneta americana TaxID=6978 RepID=UPI0037E88FE9